MPYKVWSVNEILTASDMNDYVGNQTVLSFAGTAARATAIGTPVEGMVSYVGSGVVEVYAGTATGWTQISGGGGGVTVGTAAPVSPSQGDLWWDSDDGKLFLYYDDGSSQQFVDAAGPSVAVQSTAPTGYEGQLWLDDTDGSMYVYYTDPGGGSSQWIGAVSRSGGILQVVSTTKTDTFTTTSSSFVDVTGLSASITPRSTSSKIFVLATVSGNGTPSGTIMNTRLARGGTAIFVGDAAGGRTRSGVAGLGPSGQDAISFVVSGLDSPSTTASTTYSVQVANQGNSSTVHVNRSSTDTNSASYSRTVSSITLIEVAG